ncbi:unnamed protein product [Larinioides sclopetarius]|uniref:SCP domain-containing protein n=1 Tax=Larinioides sclopetarius TaxID=280406 RepID=A0AAV1YS51_9ARAC
MTKAFYDEVATFKKEFILPFKFSKSYGHFTQMVWAESWTLGCGKVVFKEGSLYMTLIVCNYGPTGNVEKKSMYKIGKPCSDCPLNTCCGDSCKRSGFRIYYQGLCKKII